MITVGKLTLVFSGKKEHDWLVSVDLSHPPQVGRADDGIIHHRTA